MVQKILQAVIFFLFLASCYGDRPAPPPIDNVPPEIIRFEYSPDDSISTGSSVTIGCVAEDADGDSLRYEWETQGGGVITDEYDRYVVWTAGAETGSFSVLAHVSDRYETTTAAAVVHVFTHAEINQPPVITTLASDADTIAAGDTLKLEL